MVYTTSSNLLTFPVASSAAGCRRFLGPRLDPDSAVLLVDLDETGSLIVKSPNLRVVLSVIFRKKPDIRFGNKVAVPGQIDVACFAISSKLFPCFRAAITWFGDMDDLRAIVSTAGISRAGIPFCAMASTARGLCRK